MGTTESEARKEGLEIEVGKFPWAASGRALGNGRDDGFTKVEKEIAKIIEKNFSQDKADSFE